MFARSHSRLYTKLQAPRLPVCEHLDHSSVRTSGSPPETAFPRNRLWRKVAIMSWSRRVLLAAYGVRCSLSSLRCSWRLPPPLCVHHCPPPCHVAWGMLRAAPTFRQLRLRARQLRTRHPHLRRSCAGLTRRACSSQVLLRSRSRLQPWCSSTQRQQHCSRAAPAGASTGPAAALGSSAGGVPAAIVAAAAASAAASASGLCPLSRCLCFLCP